MKRWAPFLIIAAVAVITLASAASLYRTKQAQAVATAAVAAAKTSAIPSDSGSVHVRGATDAPVTLEEFADFQCPPCAALAELLEIIEADFKGRVRMLFRHFPLTTHQHARATAYAAEAAGLQGRFWEMHDLLYKNQAEWSRAQDIRPLLSTYAGVLGLDVPRFRKDIESADLKMRVTADQDRGRSLGVVNTPTLLINGKQVPPTSLNTKTLRSMIEEAEAKQNP